VGKQEYLWHLAYLKKGTVALIEKSLLGGTCVNNGCTPTKAYVASAVESGMFFHGEEMGIENQLAQKQILKK
jgi:pyruvate/2-oxoglutarate dehydrogenase complex dihydrolipoamide dehydrogenase (E3) component